MSCCDVVTSFGGAAASPSRGVEVEDGGIPVGFFETLNFEGFTVTDDGGGTVTIAAPTVTKALFLPEQWAENAMARNYADRAMACQVSTSFDTFKMITAGSITGLSTRFTQAITLGAVLVKVTKNGVATALTLNHTPGLNPSGGTAASAVGAVTYVAGDLIGVSITTDATLNPLTTDLEAMIQVTE